jgi:hypothetical protein
MDQWMIAIASTIYLVDRRDDRRRQKVAALPTCRNHEATIYSRRDLIPGACDGTGVRPL